MSHFYFLFELVALFFSSFFLSVIVKNLLVKRQWLDLPNERSSHQTPVPKSGGLGFVSVFVVWLLILGFFPGENPEISQVSLSVVAGVGLLLAVMGFGDDAISLGIIPRMLVQGLGAMLLLLFLTMPLVPFFGFEFISSEIVAIAVFVFLIWFVNLCNFMDGIDGLATLQGIFFCCALSVFSFQHSQGGLDIRLMLGLAACLSGFLVINISPAKIFMGDVGSNFLGITLPALALINMSLSGTSLWTCLALMSVFLVDSFFTLMVRVAQKQVWYHAHRSHTYQRLVAHLEIERRAILEKEGSEGLMSEEDVRSFSHKRAVLLIMLVNLLWVAPMSYLVEVSEESGIFFFVLCCLPLFVVANVLRAGRVD